MMTFGLNFKRLLQVGFTPSGYMTLGLASSASDSDVLKRGIPWWLSEGYSTKFIRGDSGPRSNPLSFSYTISEKKRTPSVYLLLTNGTRYIPTLEIPIPLNEEKGGGGARALIRAFTVLFVVCLFRILSTLLSRFVNSKPFPSRKQNIMNTDNFCKKIKSCKNNKMNSRKKGSHFP